MRFAAIIFFARSSGQMPAQDGFQPGGGGEVQCQQPSPWPWRQRDIPEVHLRGCGICGLDGLVFVGQEVVGDFSHCIQIYCTEAGQNGIVWE